jgi:hypothetical protein
LSFDILDVDHHRASRPREFRLYRIHDVARIENLAGTRFGLVWAARLSLAVLLAALIPWPTTRACCN